MLYHASKEKGLTILEPRVSTHGIAYVYAINNRITAACFGALKDDFDLLMDEINGIPHLYECYPHAIEAIYSGKNCSLYEVREEGFLSGKTGWEAELVCEHKVPVVKEECISNLLSFLTQAVAEGKCFFHTYSEDRQYQTMLCEELGERIKFLGLNNAEIKKDPRLKSFIDLRE